MLSIEAKPLAPSFDVIDTSVTLTLDEDQVGFIIRDYGNVVHIYNSLRESATWCYVPDSPRSEWQIDNPLWRNNLDVGFADTKQEAIEYAITELMCDWMHNNQPWENDSKSWPARVNHILDAAAASEHRLFNTILAVA